MKRDQRNAKVTISSGKMMINIDKQLVNMTNHEDEDGLPHLQTKPGFGGAGMDAFCIPHDDVPRDRRGMAFFCHELCWAISVLSEKIKRFVVAFRF